MGAASGRWRLGERWRVFTRDVWRDPTIRPFTATLLTGLGLLVLWLTVEYAPDAGARSRMAHGADPDGVISVTASYWTIAIMTVLTLTAGLQPIIGPRLERWWSLRGRTAFLRQPRLLRWPVIAVLGAPFALAKALSLLWSFADTLLARLMAVLAGAAHKGAPARYAHFFALMVGAILAGFLAPPGIGLPAVGAALIAILAVVRRWSWVETDRETFLIERGERERGESVLRIGFREDLRDEALIALAFLFALIPLGLDQLQTATCAAPQLACAFSFSGERPMPEAAAERYLVWLGYFGAELAKTVPFVDWSEVFHVANGSPLQAETAIGSQAAFVLRAGLDLIFLAAVLQAVQIASRLREQSRTFEANRLPILEPFAERDRFRRLAESLAPDLDLRASEQPAVRAFPRYDLDRLKEVVSGAGEAPNLSPHAEIAIRCAAAALLQHQHKGQETDRFFARRIEQEQNPAIRNWVAEVAADLDPEDATRRDDAARRERLSARIDAGDDPVLRVEAVRALGRMRLEAADHASLLARLDDPRERYEVRAAAAVALANAGVAEAAPAILALAEASPQRADPRAATAAMSIAFALRRLGRAAEVAARFPEPLRARAMWAAAIQVEPFEIDAVRDAQSADVAQMVALRPGQGTFAKTFWMGSADDDAEAFPREKPRRQVSLRRPFAIGRFPVTVAEYAAFVEAVGRPAPVHADQPRWPVTEVSWHEARAYAAWLSALTGAVYRLPSEAQWEYACRAGTDTRYPWGAAWDAARANCVQSGPNHPTDVGAYPPNQWGLFDMLGNVSEWCLDAWHTSYDGDPPSDEAPWCAGGDIANRTSRGGSWFHSPQLLGAANRFFDYPEFGIDIMGFRLVRVL